MNDSTEERVAIRYSNFYTPDGRRIGGDLRLLDIIRADADEAERVRLHLRPLTQVYPLRRIRSHQSKPFLMEDVSLPAILFLDLLKGATCFHMVRLLVPNNMAFCRATPSSAFP